MAGRGGYRYDGAASERPRKRPAAANMQARAASPSASPTSEWDLAVLTPARRLRVLGCFLASYALLVYVGYVLKENAGSLTIIWPAAGLLFITFVALPIRQWSWIVPLQLAAEIAVGSFQADQLELGWSLAFPLGNLCDALVGALLVKRWISDPTLPRLGQVALVIAA